MAGVESIVCTFINVITMGTIAAEPTITGAFIRLITDSTGGVEVALTIW